MPLFRNKKPVVYAIVAFIAALTILFSIKARADQTLTVEAGSAVVRGETPVLGFTVACQECGPVSTDYEYGFELIGTSTERESNPNVIQLRAQIVDGWRKAELGLGFYYQNVATEYVCQFGFHLMARYRFTDRISAQFRHSSSAGSCEPNTGRDVLSLGWRF